MSRITPRIHEYKVGDIPRYNVFQFILEDCAEQRSLVNTVTLVLFDIVGGEYKNSVFISFMRTDRGKTIIALTKDRVFNDVGNAYMCDIDVREPGKTFISDRDRQGYLDELTDIIFLDHLGSPSNMLVQNVFLLRDYSGKLKYSGVLSENDLYSIKLDADNLKSYLRHWLQENLYAIPLFGERYTNVMVYLRSKLVEQYFSHETYSPYNLIGNIMNMRVRTSKIDERGEPSTVWADAPLDSGRVFSGMDVGEGESVSLSGVVGTVKRDGSVVIKDDEYIRSLMKGKSFAERYGRVEDKLTVSLDPLTVPREPTLHERLRTDMMDNLSAMLKESAEKQLKDISDATMEDIIRAEPKVKPIIKKRKDV